MRFAAPIKFFQACCIAAAILFGTMRAGAQTNAFAFPAIGTYSNVLNYAVSNVTVVVFYVWAYNTNGTQNFFGTSSSSSTGPTNKYQLDQLIIVPGLEYLLGGICTNASIDKSRGIIVDVLCGIVNQTIGVETYALLYSDDTVQLVEKS